MTAPVLFVIDDDPDSLRAVETELRKRYGADYRLFCESSVDAALATRPDWVIKKASAEAEEIIDAGKAQYYEAAVDWLRRVRDAYRSVGRTDEWRKYVQSIRTEHGRKHKLMGLMERL